MLKEKGHSNLEEGVASIPLAAQARPVDAQGRPLEDILFARINFFFSFIDSILDAFNALTEKGIYTAFMFRECSPRLYSTMRHGHKAW